MQLVLYLSWWWDIEKLHFRAFNKANYTLKVSIDSKSRTLYYFVIDFFFRIVFEIRTRTPKFAARRLCKRSHCIVSSQFTIPTPRVHDYSCRCSIVKRGGQDFGRHPVFLSVWIVYFSQYSSF